jgi:hypothetical protein
MLAVVLRDLFGDGQGAARHFAEHQRLDPGGVHDAEVTAWLRHHHDAQAAAKAPRKNVSEATR